LLIKISIRKEQKKQTQRIAATKSQHRSFYSCAIKLPKKTQRYKKTKLQNPSTLKPRPQKVRRQKKVPKARELRVKKNKIKIKFPMQSKSNEKRDLQ
jgi:hypothetical protein